MPDPQPAVAGTAAPEPLVYQVLQDAMQAHRSNQTDAAGQAYRRALEIDPANPDALHLYGVLEGQLGRLDHALELIRRAAESKPLEPMFHNNLGNVLTGMERLAEAETHYRRAIELDPGRYDAMNNLAVLIGRRGDLAAAEAAFLKLLEATPGFADARENLANLYLRQGRVPEAVRQCALGLITAPLSPGLRRLLGMAYGTMGMREEAKAVYRNWLADDPGNVIATHHLAALTGEGIPDQAPEAYVLATFDTFAQGFDAKLAELEYQAPALVGNAVAAALGEPAQALRVADLGCGTGLCAPLLAPYARLLVGVDLSAPMLTRAAARQRYATLYHGDLAQFLLQEAQAWDLLVAADTLCYFGTLDAFAGAAASALAPGGLLVFTVEAHPGDDGAPPWQLHAHGRYSHRRDYLETTLRAAGFGAPQIEPVTLRQEAGEPVPGWLVRAAIAAGPTAALPAH